MLSTPYRHVRIWSPILGNQRFADEEGQDAFIPHVTLVTQISTQEEAAKILNKLLRTNAAFSLIVFQLVIPTSRNFS